MPAIFKWNGDVIQASIPSLERTSKGGMLVDAKGIKTYYPVAPIYNRLLPTIDYYKIPIKYAGRPDLIANELYRSSDLWWVIFWSNGIIDPFGKPRAGEVIRVVDINSLNKLLG